MEAEEVISKSVSPDLESRHSHSSHDENNSNLQKSSIHSFSHENSPTNELVDESPLLNVEKPVEENIILNQQISFKNESNICVVYPSDLCFLEKKVVLEIVNELKTMGLFTRLWFDADEPQSMESCTWLARSCEILEKAKVALLFMSAKSACSYSTFSIFCGILLEKLDRSQKCDFNGTESLEEMNDIDNGLQILVIPLDGSSSIASVPVLRHSLVLHPNFSLCGGKIVSVHNDWRSQPVDDIVSNTISQCLPMLERFVDTKLLEYQDNLKVIEEQRIGRSDVSYRGKSIIQWNVPDVQEWLFDIGMNEFVQQKFEEWQINGFLLLTLSDNDLEKLFLIESRVFRRKLLNSIVQVYEREHQSIANWHWKYRMQQRRENQVYIIVDPKDQSLCDTFKRDLVQLGFDVHHHTRLGGTREAFLRDNALQLASAEYVLLLLTPHACTSPFVYQEIMFTHWLQHVRSHSPKKDRQRSLLHATIVILCIQNVWDKLRPALKSALGDQPAVNFDSLFYTEGLKELENFLKPPKSVPGVIFEETYLQKANRGLLALGKAEKQLHSVKLPPVRTSQLTSNSSSTLMTDFRQSSPVVFLSYHWDMSSQAERIKRFLEHHTRVVCWLDQSALQQSSPHSSTNSLPMRPHSHFTPVINSKYKLNSGTYSGRSAIVTNVTVQRRSQLTQQESLQSYIQRSMSSAVVVIACITHKYLQSDNCLKDLSLADMLHKPILPVLLQYSPWPPDYCPHLVRRILGRLQYTDISNEKLFQRNMPELIERVKKFLPPLVLS